MKSVKKYVPKQFGTTFEITVEELANTNLEEIIDQGLRFTLKSDEEVIDDELDYE